MIVLTCKYFHWKYICISNNISQTQFAIPPLLVAISLPLLYSRSTPLISPHQERAGFQTAIQDNKTMCILRLDKDTQKEEWRPQSTCTVGAPQKHQAYSHNMYTEGLVQTPTGPVLVLLVYESPAYLIRCTMIS